MRRSVVILALFALASFGGCGGSTTATSAPSPPTTPEPAATASATPPASVAPSIAPIPFSERLEAEIAVPGSPDWPLAAFDSIWVLAPDLPLQTGGGAPNLVRIDPATNEVVATIALPDRLCQGFTASDDAIWACSIDSLVRIDPATNEIADRVPVASGQAFYQPVFGGGMVWALASEAFRSDTVIRLDPATKTITPFRQAGSVGGLVYAFDALWLTLTGDGSLVRLDPATGDATVVATDLPGPTGVVAGAGSLWVSLHGGEDAEAGPGDTQLVRIDPASGETLADFAIGGSPKGGVGTWADDETVLVRSTTPWMVRIDPATDEIVETLVSDTPVQGPVTVAYGSIWTIDIERDVVHRLSR